jgi:hypothetical protein
VRRAVAHLVVPAERRVHDVEQPPAQDHRAGRVDRVREHLGVGRVAGERPRVQ